MEFSIKIYRHCLSGFTRRILLIDMIYTMQRSLVNLYQIRLCSGLFITFSHIFIKFKKFAMKIDCHCSSGFTRTILQIVIIWFILCSREARLICMKSEDR
jgi:hypothetical protein